MSSKLSRLIRGLSVVVLLIAAREASADAAAGSVKGRVVDAANRPNESVKVTLMRGEKELATGYSDTDGKFTLKDVPAGKGYTLIAVRAVRVATMSGRKEDVSVKRGETTDIGDVLIQLGNPN